MFLLWAKRKEKRLFPKLCYKIHSHMLLGQQILYSFFNLNTPYRVFLRTLVPSFVKSKCSFFLLIFLDLSIPSFLSKYMFSLLDVWLSCLLPLCLVSQSSAFLLLNLLFRPDQLCPLLRSWKSFSLVKGLIWCFVLSALVCSWTIVTFVFTKHSQNSRSRDHT